MAVNGRYSADVPLRNCSLNLPPSLPGIFATNADRYTVQTLYNKEKKDVK